MKPAYHALYKTASWQRLRSQRLLLEPLCRLCAHQGRVRAATVVDHIVPHKGDAVLFWDRHNLQSLCKPCHDKDKQAEERNGFTSAIGADGWPTDPRHPANR
jgi:5-methylcytosine-specific restriction protein A